MQVSSFQAEAAPRPTLITQVRVRRYERPFCRPLHTAHGLWQERQGLLVRIVFGDGRVGFGEVAPLPWFGSETLEAAEAFWAGLCPGGVACWMPPPPDSLPASQFAWSMAIATAAGLAPAPPLPSCTLLPSGAAALTAWQPLWQAGKRCFKWKIGIAAMAEEQALFQDLMATFPQEARIRLDANGGLEAAEAERWLERCAAYPSVEFLEQPLPPPAFERMRELGDRFPTPLALDESVATVAQLRYCHHRGWPGIFVIKPGIAGLTDAWLPYVQAHQLPVVLSSVLEWAIARAYIQTLLPQLPGPVLAPGLDVGAWFMDDGLDALSPDALWNHLAP